MIEVLGFAFFVIVSNLIFLLIGFLAGDQSLQGKLKSIKQFQFRTKASSQGPVTPLNPQELEKERNKEFRDRFGI